jgi:hypothetical protein
MNRVRTTIDGNTRGSPSQIGEDYENASDAAWDKRDTTIHYPYLTSGKVPTEKLYSCEDLLESSLMDRKPSAKEKIPCEAKPELLHARSSQTCLGRSGQDHSHRISSFSRHESLKSMLHRPPRSWDRFQVELLPGHYVPLIGSDETWQAFCEDNVIHIECSSCQMFLYCKRTAEMVMCPGCRMISPIDEVDDVGRRAEGLGLGLSVAAAFEMLES